MPAAVAAFTDWEPDETPEPAGWLRSNFNTDTMRRRAAPDYLPESETEDERE